MRTLFTCLALATISGGNALLSQTKAPPVKLVLPAKNGSIVFDHAAHLRREKNDCKVCHAGLFAEDSKAPVAFRPPHKNEEDKKLSCGACHRGGGPAFESKGNCTNGKCHLAPGAK